jgi:phosphatidylglycerophosphate synthase
VTLSVRNDAAVNRPAVAVHPPTVGLLAQVALLAGLAAGVGLGPAGWLAGTGYAVVTWALLSQALHRPGGAGWGTANTVTLVRGILAGGVTALVADSLWGPAPVALLVAIAAVALALDGVDGQVARRTGTTSRLGARFDMETDAILVLVLSVFVAGSLGWWVLAFGVPRYVFAVAARGLPWLRGPLPPRLSRKAVAATQGIVLVVASAGVLPGVVTTASVGAVLALVCWSFGRDVDWLWRFRRRGRESRQEMPESRQEVLAS